MMRHHKYSILVAILLGLWTVRCGSAGKAAQVNMSVIPGQPSVITADFQLNSSTTISNPWYAFQMNITNNSDETVTIIALQLHVTATRVDGSTITKDLTISPSMYNETVDCGGGVTDQVNFTDFGMYPADGVTRQISLTPRNTTTVCGSAFTPLTPLLYAGSNPSKNNDHVMNYTFTVQLSPAGWFGTITAPDTRFDKIVLFTTN